MKPSTWGIGGSLAIMVGWVLLVTTLPVGASTVTVGTLDWVRLDRTSIFDPYTQGVAVVNDTTDFTILGAKVTGTRSGLGPEVVAGPQDVGSVLSRTVSSGALNPDEHNWGALILQSTNGATASIDFNPWSLDEGPNPNQGRSRQANITATLNDLTLGMSPVFYGAPGTEVLIFGFIINSNPGWVLELLTNNTALAQGPNYISFGTVAIPADSKGGQLIFSGSTPTLQASRNLTIDPFPYSVVASVPEPSTLLSVTSGVLVGLGFALRARSPRGRRP